MTIKDQRHSKAIFQLLRRLLARFPSELSIQAVFKPTLLNGGLRFPAPFLELRLLPQTS
jgi:hypothetical protein